MASNIPGVAHLTIGADTDSGALAGRAALVYGTDGLSCPLRARQEGDQGSQG
jgi:hypothetical protein